MLNNLNHIPLLRLLIPFIAGIISVVYLKPNATYLFCSFGLVSGLYLLIVFIKKINANYNKRWLFGLLLYLNLLLAGACLTSLKYKDTNTTTQLLTDKSNQLLIGEITKPIQVKEKTIKAVLQINRVKNNNKWMVGKGKVLIYFQKDSFSIELNQNDIIVFEPKLINVPAPKNPNEFDYKKYLSFHLIHQQAYLHSNDWKLIQKSSGIGIFKFANNTRKYLINLLKEKGIEGNELAVASALILGYKDNIDPQLKNAYSSAGAMHVLAVSGLHVGIIFFIFNQLFHFFEKVKYGRIIKGILLLLLLWSYALITGLSPSVMRAATMFSFIVVAKMTKRNSSFFNTLAASALALLIYNPLMVMEVGFQLSYLAVIGIVIIQPWINNWFHIKRWLPRKLWEITAVSIAAQIATFPLGLLYFHQFPNYFLLSNLIVIPLAIVILYLGLATLFFSFVPILGDYLAISLKYIIHFLNSSVGFIDSLPYSLSENIRFNVLDTWLIYLAIGSFILLIAYRKFYFLLMGSSLIILFLLSSLSLKYHSLNQKELFVYNIPQHTAINFIDGENNILVADNKLIQNRNKLLFHVQNNWINKGVSNEKVVPLDILFKKYPLPTDRLIIKNLFTKNNFFQFHTYRIAIIDYRYKIKKNRKKLKVDLVILCNSSDLSIEKVLSAFDVEEIVVDASNSVYTSNRLSTEAKKYKIKCWSVIKDGAYLKNI
jgi:competence protein ComEC